MSLPYELYSVKQIRELENEAMLKVTEDMLMEKAGTAAFRYARERFPYAMNIIVLAGGGNNGGDGFVFARLAQQIGMKVQVYTLGNLDNLTDAAKKAHDALNAFGINIMNYSENTLLDDTDLVVDAMLGIGLSGEVRGQYREAIAKLNEADVPVFSIDVPSGIDADTGQVLGDAVIATMTITFIGVKKGLVTGQAVSYCGELVCDELGLTDEFSEQSVSALRIDEQDISDLLPEREMDVHKGVFGHVLVVGGDTGMPGAVRLASEAALRVGAGLVTVVTHENHIPIVLSGRPELMCFGVSDSLEKVDELLSKVSVCLIGPGLSDSEWSKRLIEKVLQFDGHKVIDAGALEALKLGNGEHLKNTTITPHPGEAARLLDCPTSEIQNNRFDAAVKLCKKFSQTVILKGAGSIIQSHGELPYVCNLGNPGMATAGTGDVLSGMIAGFLAQGMSHEDAAVLSVVVHGDAGDRAAAVYGEQGLLASHLFEFFNESLKTENTAIDWLDDESE